MRQRVQWSRILLGGALVAALALGPARALEVWAQGTAFLNRTVRIGAATPYTMTFPAAQAAGVLTNDGVGTLTWAAGVPTGMIAYINGACPSGWSEFTAARGNYIVGLPLSGTLNTQVGTALTNLENRAVGQHTHIQDAHNHTQNAHNHAQDAHQHGGKNATNAAAGNSTPSGGWVAGNPSDTDDQANKATVTTTATNQAATATNQATTATNQNAGSVVGTNAPYIHLRPCQKD